MGGLGAHLNNSIVSLWNTFALKSNRFWTSYNTKPMYRHCYSRTLCDIPDPVHIYLVFLRVHCLCCLRWLLHTFHQSKCANHQHICESGGILGKIWRMSENSTFVPYKGFSTSIVNCLMLKAYISNENTYLKRVVVPALSCVPKPGRLQQKRKRALERVHSSTFFVVVSLVEVNLGESQEQSLLILTCRGKGLGT